MNPLPKSCESLQIPVNPLPKSCKSLQILSQSIANPRESLPKSHKSSPKVSQILSQSLANPCESSPKVSRILANPHESSPKVSQILSQSLANAHEFPANPLPKSHESLRILSQSLVNPFLIISNTPYLVNCIQPTNSDINTELIFIVMGMNTGTICFWNFFWGFARIHKDFVLRI